MYHSIDARDCRSIAGSIPRSIQLQYAYRTEQAGVCDSLQDLTQQSIVEWIEALGLGHWEVLWGDLGRYGDTQAAHSAKTGPAQAVNG